jgi:hypothetical protein
MLCQNNTIEDRHPSTACKQNVNTLIFVALRREVVYLNSEIRLFLFKESPFCASHDEGIKINGGHCLLFLGALGLAGGAILARRFAVFILLPAILLAVPTTIVAELLSGHKVPHSLIAAVYVAVGLQLGYGLGVILGGLAVKRHIGHPVRPFASNRLDGR